MQLTCLGGAAAWPNPGQGCSSFLLRDGEATLLLDVGPNTILELRKHVLYSTVTAIVVSHCHSDHILDLVPYRYGLAYGREKPRQPIPLWMPPGGIAVLDALAATLGGQGEAREGFWSNVFDVQEYDPDRTLTAGGFDIDFFRTEHASECYALRVVDRSGMTLTYTADTGSIDPLVTFATGSELLIVEATLPESDEPDSSAGHLMPSQAGQLATMASIKNVVLTHLWAERPDPEVIAGAASTYSGNILIAKPGLVVDV